MAWQLMVLLIGIVGLVRLQPDLPLSHLLYDWLARRPSRWLLRRSRRELIAWAIVALLIACAGESVLLIGGPQIAIGVAVDMAAYIDAIVTVVALASFARVRAVAQWFAPRLRTSPRARSRRARRQRTARSAANDSGEDRPARLVA